MCVKSVFNDHTSQSIFQHEARPSDVLTCFWITKVDTVVVVVVYVFVVVTIRLSSCAGRDAAACTGQNRLALPRPNALVTLNHGYALCIFIAGCR